MGSGILLKALRPERFSLMVFGWTQIVMDLQPLVAMLSGRGELHSFTHTWIGAGLLAVVAALSGKYLGARQVYLWTGAELGQSELEHLHFPEAGGSLLWP
jgi:hypothetical protein